MSSLKYILVAVLGMAAVAASAQPPPGAPGGPPHGGHGFGGPLDNDPLAILLDLDPYQKNQVQTVLTAQREAMKAERQQARASGQRPSFEEMRAKRQANEDAIVGQLSTVLSDTQITKLKVLMEPPMRGPRGPRGGPPPNGAPNDVPAAK
jgi:Spy/CpxP family protein refolding chaperone